MPAWKQSDYHSFWTDVIRRFARTVVFADGWQYSAGCALEYFAAFECGAETLDANFAPLDLPAARHLLGEAINQLQAMDALRPTLRSAYAALTDAHFATNSDRAR